MTPTAFRAALDRLGLSQVEAAALIGVDKMTVHRWTKGTRPIPPTVPVIMTLIDALGIEKARKKLGDA